MRHVDADRRTDELCEDGPTFLSVRGPIATGAGEDDRLRPRATERFGQRSGYGADGIRRRQKVRAAARPTTDHGTIAVHGERARLRPACVDAHDQQCRHQGWWIAPPETERDAPVAPGRMFGCPRIRYAPRIANATASREATGMPSSSLVRTVSGATAERTDFRSVGLRAPPPATMSSRQVTPGRVSRLSASATVRAVSAIAVASASSRVPPLCVTRLASSSANGLPKSSRPVLLG